jgi:hypothetical protein
LFKKLFFKQRNIFLPVASAPKKDPFFSRRSVFLQAEQCGGQKKSRRMAENGTLRVGRRAGEVVTPLEGNAA